PEIAPRPEVAIACVDAIADKRQPAAHPSGGPLLGSGSVALDPTWSGYATASVRAVLGDAVPLHEQSVVHGQTTVVVVSGADRQGRRVSAFTVHGPDTDRQVAHRVCGHAITAVLPRGARTVEVQLDDGSAVRATPDRLLEPQ
ncbi:MAG: hypothetical protein AAF721_27365, partial [Myxococcota bacterium]